MLSKGWEGAEIGGGMGRGGWEEGGSWGKEGGMGKHGITFFSVLVQGGTVVIEVLLFPACASYRRKGGRGMGMCMGFGDGRGLDLEAGMGILRWRRF
jgi:hypothetical protein